MTNYIFIHSSRACNARCWFCMHSNLPYKNDNINKNMPKYLNPKDIMFENLPTNIDVLEVTALGEPTCNPEIELLSDVVSSFCRKNKIKSSIFTNGFNLNALKHIQDVNISMHSLSSKNRENIFGKDFLSIDKIREFLDVSHADSISLQFLLAKEKGIETMQDVYEIMNFIESIRDKRIVPKFRELRNTRDDLSKYFIRFDSLNIPEIYREKSKGCDKYPVISTDGQLYTNWSLNEKMTYEYV